MLKSALKNGYASQYMRILYLTVLCFVKRSQVQRIVITSSCAAVLSLPLSKPTVFSEQDWNLGSIKEVEENGNKSHPGTVYRASKTLAEKGWLFLNILSFDLPLKFMLTVSCNQRPGVFMSSTSPRLNGI